MFTKKYWLSWRKTDDDAKARVREMRKKKGGKKKKKDEVIEDYSGDINIGQDSNRSQKDSVKKEK